MYIKTCSMSNIDSSMSCPVTTILGTAGSRWILVAYLCCLVELNASRAILRRRSAEMSPNWKAIDYCFLFAACNLLILLMSDMEGVFTLFNFILYWEGKEKS